MNGRAASLKQTERWLYMPTEDEKHVAFWIAKRRNRLNGGGSNLPNETVFGVERERQHFFSALSEIGGSRMLNLCWTGCGRGADADVCDIGNMAEARSIIKPTRGLIVTRKDKSWPPYILIYVNPESKMCHALGWHEADYVRQHGWALHENAWVLPQGQTLPMNLILPRLGL